MSERDWKGEEEKRRGERLQAIKKFFDSNRKKGAIIIFTTPYPPRIRRHSK